MLKPILAILLLLSSPFALAEPKVCLPNDANGMIVLTHEACTSDKPLLVDTFPYRAYATEGNGTIHEGCFEIPSIEEAKPQPGTKIIPIVNFIELEDYTIHVFHAEWFTIESCPVEETI
jgi:hypothetical protein